MTCVASKRLGCKLGACWLEGKHRTKLQRRKASKMMWLVFYYRIRTEKEAQSPYSRLSSSEWQSVMA